MSDLELTGRELTAVKEFLADSSCECEPFRRTIYKLQGAKLKAEFWRDHTEYPGIDGDKDCDICYWVEPFTLDPRHRYTDDQWLEAGKDDL